MFLCCFRVFTAIAVLVLLYWPNLIMSYIRIVALLIKFAVKKKKKKKTDC